MGEKSEQPGLSRGRAKRFRRYFNALIGHGDPDKLNSPHDAVRLVFSAAVVAVVSLYHNAAGLRGIGLVRTAELGCEWLAGLPHRWIELSDLPDALADAIIADAGARAEVLDLLRASKAMGKKMERLLQEAPEELTTILAARLRELHHKAAEELPRVMKRMSDALPKMREVLDEMARIAAARDEGMGSARIRELLDEVIAKLRGKGTPPPRGSAP